MSDRIVVDTATLEQTGKQLRRLQQNLQDLSNQLDRIDLTRDSGGRLAFETVQKLEFSGMRVVGENVDETINAYRQGLKETGRHAEKLMRTLHGLQDDIEQLENRLRAQVERLDVGEVAFGAEPVVEGTSLGVEAIVPNVFQPLSYDRPVTRMPSSVGAQALQQVADAMADVGADFDSAHAEFVPLMHDRPGLERPHGGAGASFDSAHAEFVPLMHDRPGLERPHGGAGASFDSAHAEFVPLMHDRPGLERPHGGAGASFDSAHAEFVPLMHDRPGLETPDYVGAGATLDSAHAEFVPLMHDRPGLNMPDYVGAGATLDSAHAEFVPLMHDRPGLERPHGGAGASFDTPSGSNGSGGGHRF